MIKLILSIFIIILLCSCNYQENSNNAKTKHQEPQNNPITDSVKLWLTSGKHQGDIMNAFAPRITYLSEIFAKSISENQEWYFKFMNENSELENLPFHKNFGLTVEEYAELLELQSNYEVFPSATEQFEIFKENGTILFKTNEKTIQMLNYISFNLKENVAILSIPGQSSISLTLKDTINVKNDKHAYKSKWHGYTWTNEIGTLNQNIDNVKNISEMDSFTIFEFALGLMDKDNRVFLSVKIKSLIDGEVIANNELPILIK